MVVGGKRHAPAALPWKRDAVPIIQEVGWAPGSAWTGIENLAFNRDSNPGTFQPVASCYPNYAFIG